MNIPNDPNVSVIDKDDLAVEHAMACVQYGDCIYDVVQEGAKSLETKWTSRTRIWEDLIDKAVRTGFMGWGAPLVDRKWLKHVLFLPRSQWPRGLTKREVQMLDLASAAAMMQRQFDTQIDPFRGLRENPDQAEAEDRTLAALKKYAALFDRQVFDKMWADYDQVSEDYGRKILPLCEQRYQEPCTLQDAINIFKGDLRRGMKAKTIDLKVRTYQALREFLPLISA
jgi:hypothetical protein